MAHLGHYNTTKRNGGKWSHTAHLCCRLLMGQETWNSETEKPYCSTAWGHMGEQRAEELLD